MAAFTLFPSFREALAEKTHNLGSDQLVIALTNSAPLSSYDQLADITEVAYTFLSSRNITTSSSGLTGSTYNLKLNNLVLTSTGGSTGPFRYVVVYNTTAAGDELIGYADHGSSITLSSGQTYTIGFNALNGLLSY